MSFNGYRANLPFIPTGTFTGETFGKTKNATFPLDLNKKLITHPTATYCMCVDTDELTKFEIHKDDLILIDRSEKPLSHSLVVFFYDGEFSVEYLANIPNGVAVWGIITYVIHKKIQ